MFTKRIGLMMAVVLGLNVGVMSFASQDTVAKPQGVVVASQKTSG